MANDWHSGTTGPLLNKTVASRNRYRHPCGAGFARCYPTTSKSTGNRLAGYRIDELAPGFST
ncbi:hypothetical protein [Paracoccus pacificus]|uniref:Uncharacterized protein n=1 Tax=Paracoccus pacificus TaxID=1463598 RepID=A0ABW4R4J7_9RHOB